MQWTYAKRAHVLVSAMVLSVAATTSWSQSITWLGTLGGVESAAWSVSNEAQVVGSVRFANGYNRAFRWVNGNMYALIGTGISSEATGISADGTVIVGWNVYNAHSPGPFAFRWLGGGLHSLGTLGGNASAAWGVSSDGSVIVGWARPSLSTVPRAFRWTTAGMQNLGTLGGGQSAAYGVSADGSVVVGWGTTPAIGGAPFAGPRRQGW